MSAVEAGLVKAGLVKKGLVTAITLAGRRYFRRNSGGIDYALIPEVTLSGDFEVGFLAWSSDLGTASIFLGNSASANGFIAGLGGGSVRFRDDLGDTVETATGVFSVTDSNLIFVKKSGGVVTIFVNGVLSATGNSTGAFTFDNIYRYTSGFNLKGIIDNLKITDKSQAIENVNTVGPELYGTVTATDSGSGFVDGVVTLVQDAGNEFAQTNAPVITGEPFLMEYEVFSFIDVAGSDLYISNSVSADFSLIPSSVGKHAVLVAPLFSDDLRIIIRGAPANTAVMEINSVKQVTSFSKLIRSYAIDDNSDILANGATSLGDNEVVNGDFSDGLNGWVGVNSTLSVISSQLRVTNDGTSTGLAYQPVELLANVPYRITSDVKPGTAPLPQFSIHANPIGDLTVGILAGGPSVAGFVYTPSSSGTYYLAVGNRGSNNAGLFNDFDNISIRQADGYGQIINGLTDDWGLFTEQSRGGDWLGVELADQLSALLPAEYVDGVFHYWNLNTAEIGLAYRVVANIIGPISAANDGAGWSTSSGVPFAPPFRVVDGSSGFVGGDYTASASAVQRIYYSDGSGPTEFSDISVKELLKVAT